MEADVKGKNESYVRESCQLYKWKPLSLYYCRRIVCHSPLTCSLLSFTAHEIVYLAISPKKYMFRSTPTLWNKTSVNVLVSLACLWPLVFATGFWDLSLDIKGSPSPFGLPSNLKPPTGKIGYAMFLSHLSRAKTPNAGRLSKYVCDICTFHEFNIFNIS